MVFIHLSPTIFIHVSPTLTCAQGMVEKWLLQVEDVMIMSLRKVIKESVEAYRNSSRDRWVLEWPGQVVLCTTQIDWTEEVSNAMKEKDGVEVGAAI